MSRVYQMIGVLCVGLLAACSGPSSEEVKTYSEACVDFYKEKRAKYSDDVEYRKHWMKDEKIVIALKVERRGESGYAEGICVVDPQEGTVQIPSLFDQARWAN